MRYELDSNGYILNVYFGCSSGNCTEYTGTIPDGYETLGEWAENANIRAYKIVNGNLVYDANKATEIEAQAEIDAEENAYATHKYVKELLEGGIELNANNNEEIANLFPQKTVTGTLVNCKESGNFKIPKITISKDTIPMYNLFDINDTYNVGTNITVDDDDYIFIQGDNTSGTNYLFKNYFTRNSKHLKPNTKYYAVLEVKEVTGTGTLYILSTYPANSTQFTGNKSFSFGMLTNNCKRFFEMTTLSDLTLTSIYSMLRTFVQFNIGQSGSIKFRMSVLEKEPNIDTFVYRKFGEISDTDVQLISTNRNIMPNEAVTTSDNGIDYTVNDDRSITLSGTSTTESKLNICGDETNTTPLFYLKKNIDYYLNSGYDLSFYNYDGTNRTLVGTFKNQTIKVTDSDKPITQVVLTVPGGTKVDTTIFIQLEYGTSFTNYAMHKENTQTFTVTENDNVFENTDLLGYNDMTNIYTTNEDMAIDVDYIINSMYDKTNGINSLELTSCFDSNYAINKLSITGFTEKTTFPSETLYPSSTLYPNVTTASHTLVVDTSTTPTANKKEYAINTYLIEGDELLIENGVAKVIRADGTEEEFEDPLYIKTFDGNTVIYLKDYANLKYYCEYMPKSYFSDVYCTKTEKNASIKLTADEINSEVRKKVGFDEIISSINQTAEEVKIKANKISLEGTVTANEKFKVLDDGSMEAVNANFIMRDDDTGIESGYASFKSGANTISGEKSYYADMEMQAVDNSHNIVNHVSEYRGYISVSGRENVTDLSKVTLQVEDKNDGANKIPSLEVLHLYNNDDDIAIYETTTAKPDEIDFSEVVKIHNYDGTLLLRCNKGTSIVNYNNGAFVPIKASAFTQSSSRRYKENIEAMTEEEADKILNLEVVTFDYKQDSKMSGKNVAGMIAEDVADILPNTVTNTIIDEKEVPDAIDYSKFVPYLIKEIQMLKKEIKELKGEN